MARGGYPGGMGGNMQQLMRQAQKMQEKMAAKQEELNAREFTASAGGGAVQATVYGRKELKSIAIDPDCVSPDDVEMLQDMILAAVNEALRQADEIVNAEMGKITGGMNLGF